MQNFLSNGNTTQTGLEHQILIDQKGRIELRKETISKAGIEFFIRRAKFRQTAWHQDFFAVSLKIVWDPDWWPAKAFATVLCGKPSLYCQPVHLWVTVIVKIRLYLDEDFCWKRLKVSYFQKIDTFTFSITLTLQKQVFIVYCRLHSEHLGK